MGFREGEISILYIAFKTFELLPNIPDLSRVFFFASEPHIHKLFLLIATYRLPDTIFS
jgi:hypothetical protein